MEPELKQQIKELAILVLKELDYYPDALSRFRRADFVDMYSEEPGGILFDLPEKELGRVKELEDMGYLCYAVIKGCYADGDGDMVQATTYLVLCADDLTRYNNNLTCGELPLDDILDRYSGQYANLGYRTWAYCNNDYGTVAIKGRSGGLTRTC